MAEQNNNEESGGLSALLKNVKLKKGETSHDASKPKTSGKRKQQLNNIIGSILMATDIANGRIPIQKENKNWKNKFDPFLQLQDQWITFFVSIGIIIIIEFIFESVLTCFLKVLWRWIKLASIK